MGDSLSRRDWLKTVGAVSAGALVLYLTVALSSRAGRTALTPSFRTKVPVDR